MGTICGSPAGAQVREKPIFTSKKNFEGALNSLEEYIKILPSRLEPILSNTPTVPPSLSEKTPEVGSSPFAGDFDTYISRINQCNDSLRILLDKLEI